MGNGEIGENVPALEFAGLVKRFGGNVAVDHIDLAVPAGSFFGLVGPNGAGKTTSLSMAVGLVFGHSTIRPAAAARSCGAGVSGKLTVVNDAHGGQVAYNGHLLYTFISDRPGQVTGQGVQGFVVATPGIAPVAATSAPAGTAPATPSGGGYGY